MATIHVTTNPYSELQVAEGRMASRNSEHVLALQGTRYRFGIGYSEASTWVNRGPDMPRKFITTPEAYAYGLASCITANPALSTGAEIERNRAAGIEHEVSAGDVVVTDRQYAFAVRPYRREYLALDYVGPWSAVEASAEATSN